ncbi:MAG: hypothetical protein JO026_03610, partial [Patescibacteria group bacterium]|nr:hypothetical protein [Patescibacteria group bacterium]
MKEKTPKKSPISQNRKKKPRAKSKNQTRKKPGVVSEAIEAAVEIGHAAESLKESFEHVKKARSRGGKIVKKAKRA